VQHALNPVTTAADNFYFFERTAPDTMELRTKRLLNGSDLGSETVPAAGDRGVGSENGRSVDVDRA
jgi:hypothetical protein